MSCTAHVSHVSCHFLPLEGGGAEYELRKFTFLCHFSKIRKYPAGINPGLVLDCDRCRWDEYCRVEAEEKVLADSFMRERERNGAYFEAERARETTRLRRMREEEEDEEDEEESEGEGEGGGEEGKGKGRDDGTLSKANRSLLEVILGITTL